MKTSNKHLIIETNNLGVNFGHFQALKEINFKINAGDFLYVIGPNGAGKSTLIKVLVSLLKPTQGSYLIKTDEIGFLPQALSVKRRFPITVCEVIYTGFKQQKRFIGKDDLSLIRSWLKKMEIGHLEKKMMSTLSGGEAQRVFLIRALIANPKLLILDEPTSALDPHFKETFYQYIRELNKNGTTIIFVTHDLNLNVRNEDLILSIDQDVSFFGLYQAFNQRLGGHKHV
ncbi:MAG: ATP-binding cassette domain-containing protein [Acholeplasmataceae bacterium]